MELHFLPAIVSGEVRAFDEVVALASTGNAAIDVMAFERDDGTITKALRLGRTVVDIRFHQALENARSGILEALKLAEIHAVVQDPTSEKFYRVPRTYWYTDAHLLRGTINLPDDAGTSAARFDGQPILAEVSSLSDWKEAAYPGYRKQLAVAPSLTEHDDKRADPEAHKERLQQVADKLDAAPTPKRRVQREDVDAHWQSDWGAPPKVETVRALMKGGKKGAPKNDK